jgi:hypothetical protein
MIRRLLPVVLGLIGLAGLAAAAYLHLPRPTLDHSAVEVEAPQPVLDKLVVGREYDVEFRLHNRSGHPLRVVGSLYD